jgi:hypothetical protein
MHFSVRLETLWIGFLFFLLIMMVSCDAPGCSWARERATDNRGLSRHRANCRFYKRVSSLASQRRKERAKEAVGLNLLPKPSVSVSVLSLPHIEPPFTTANLRLESQSSGI